MGRGLSGRGEEHIGRLEVPVLAVVQVKDKVVFENVIVRGEAEFAGGLIDGVGRAFELDEGADGSFVEIDQEALGPGEVRRETIRGAIFLVAEPALEAEALEDSLEGGGIGEDDFDFFADFVAAVVGSAGGADGEFFGWGFEGEDGAKGGFSPRLLPCRGRGFGANAEELTVLGEAAVGSVEDDVVFVDAGGDRLGAEFFESAEEGFGVRKTEFDFGFTGHGAIVAWDEAVGHKDAGRKANSKI